MSETTNQPPPDSAANQAELNTETTNTETTSLPSDGTTSETPAIEAPASEDPTSASASSSTTSADAPPAEQHESSTSTESSEPASEPASVVNIPDPFSGQRVHFYSTGHPEDGQAGTVATVINATVVNIQLDSGAFMTSVFYRSSPENYSAVPFTAEELAAEAQVGQESANQPAQEASSAPLDEPVAEDLVAPEAPKGQADVASPDASSVETTPSQASEKDDYTTVGTDFPAAFVGQKVKFYPDFGFVDVKAHIDAKITFVHSDTMVNVETLNDKSPYTSVVYGPEPAAYTCTPHPAQ